MAARCTDGGLHVGSSEFQSHLRALRQIDFELAYLVLLTREGLKPLSRWEKPLDEGVLGLLQQMHLATRQMRRTVKTGQEVIETVFSRTLACIRLYEQSFAGTPIDKSPATQRIEGFLFGYPPCCVEQYVRKPYAPNDLADRDREILFHWACPRCKVTPVLLDAYRSIHDLLSRC
ncbi:MAG: hypothetical protein JSW66_02475 [Phycisphaerales bacterium]|nr:MAG: hypothetical protein JSW66_02475 [Phycisphaerales bacterium]